DGSAPVKIFVMGIDQWRDEQDWPLPDTRYVPYYLHGSGRANTAAGDGVLCFTSPVLTEPLEVTGHVKLTLFASSSAPDTDFTGKLVDVFPDGRAIFLTDGIIRARYHNSLAEPELLTPG